MWFDKESAVAAPDAPARILSVSEKQSECSDNIGIVKGLTKDGFLIIKKKSGETIIHVSGDIIELKEGQK